MPERAQVRSVEAIEAFRSNVIVYLSQARPALEEVSAEAVRTRAWLETEQRTHWEQQLSKRRKHLDEIQQALFSGRLGTLRKESAVDQMLFHRARRAVEEAEEKLRVIKRWTRDFDNRVQPLLKQIEKLQTVLSLDMVQASAQLAQTVQVLAAYADVPVAPVEPPAATMSQQATTSGPVPPSEKTV